jgi:hypothetical protein
MLCRNNDLQERFSDRIVARLKEIWVILTTSDRETTYDLQSE